MSSTSPASHPDGPRTLWTQLRDSVPIPAGVLARGRALEEGRHPTLTELREALGLDLELSAAWGAARKSASQLGAVPSDDDLSTLLDAMYGALSSARLVRATLTDEGLHLLPATAPLRVREGERLALFVFFDNVTATEIEFAAEAPGRRVGGRVEPRRTRSVLLPIETLPAGEQLVQLTIVAGERTVNHGVRVECAPSGELAVEILNDNTGSPVAARVYLSDDLGEVRANGAMLRRDQHGRAFFHADGAFSARICGSARLLVMRGLEYEPLDERLVVAPGSETSATVRLKRWAHIAAEGWQSGDVHVHLHYGGEYLLRPQDASLAQRAEDVHFMNMMVANQGSGFVHDEGFFEGAPHELSDSNHILRWGEEYRNDFYGHMCMFGIAELVPPIYSGFRLSEHPHDLPANADAAAHCHTVGGTLSYAHPLFGSTDLDRVFARARTVEAKELPVDAALGRVDALDVMSYPGVDLETADLWYRLLNCGLRLPATAGTDTFMNVAAGGVFSNPPAGNRVFVRVDGNFTTESWCEGVRQGRTFVTNGPILRLKVAGHDIGETIDAQPGEGLAVEAEAESFAPMERIELIVNGRIVASAEAFSGGRAATLRYNLSVRETCWLALRAIGPADPLVLGGDLFAHSSPIYVTVRDTPLPCAEDAAYFVEWIERLIAMVQEHGNYPNEADRDKVIALFRTGQDYYRRLAAT
ncbi:MAG: CehA/McbA family metallohydrolase [Dehalococcoidia bacterium]